MGDLGLPAWLAGKITMKTATPTNDAPNVEYASTRSVAFEVCTLERATMKSSKCRPPTITS
jgi:hypothetical protein